MTKTQAVVSNAKVLSRLQGPETETSLVCSQAARKSWDRLLMVGSESEPGPRLRAFRPTHEIWDQLSLMTVGRDWML